MCVYVCGTHNVYLYACMYKLVLVCGCVHVLMCKQSACVCCVCVSVDELCVHNTNTIKHNNMKKTLACPHCCVHVACILDIGGCSPCLHNDHLESHLTILAALFVLPLWSRLNAMYILHLETSIGSRSSVANNSCLWETFPACSACRRWQEKNTVLLFTELVTCVIYQQIKCRTRREKGCTKK